MLAGSPLERLRPRSAGRLLDGGFEVVRFRPRQLATLLVVTWIPVFVASIYFGGYSEIVRWVVRSTISRSEAVSLRPDFPTAALGGVAALMFGEMLTGVGIGVLVSGWVRGVDPSSREMLREVWRRSPVAFAAWFVALLVKLVSGALLGVGILATAPMLGVLGPVIGAEQHRPVAAIRRSFDLTRRSRNLAQGLFLLSPLLGLGVWGAMSASNRFGLLPVPYLADALVALVAAALTAWRASVWALMYINARVVSEGLDLRLELVRVMP